MWVLNYIIGSLFKVQLLFMLWYSYFDVFDKSILKSAIYFLNVNKTQEICFSWKKISSLVSLNW